MVNSETRFYGWEPWHFERDLNDKDQDSIPDAVELSWGLDPDDATDAALDLDNDGVSNAIEHQLGMSLTNPDSDRDGLLDGWEVNHGLTPTLFDAHVDNDQDGLSNLAESGSPTEPFPARAALCP